MVIAACLGLLIPLIGPFIFLCGLGAFLVFLYRAIARPLQPPDPKVLASVTATLQTRLTGDCPSCAKTLIVPPSGTTFTLHCPLCGVPLRYDRGWMHADRA